MPAQVTGHMAGSITRRGLDISTFTRACCYLPCSRIPGHCCARRAAVRAGGWLVEALAPQAMQIALRHRLPLSLCPNRYGPDPGCGQSMGQFSGDHASALVAREAVGPDGQVARQQWLSCTTAARMPAVRCAAMPRWFRPSRGLGTHGQTRRAPSALCARGAELRRPNLRLGGPWNGQTTGFVNDLVSARAQRAPPALRRMAASRLVAPFAELARRGCAASRRQHSTRAGMVCSCSAPAN